MEKHDVLKPLSETMSKEEMERLINEQIQEIEILRNSDHWVPVTERLPDEKGHYLVTSELNYYHGGCWDETEKGTSRSLAIAYYDGTDKIGGKNYWNHSHVIAWKSIPDFYRG